MTTPALSARHVPTRQERYYLAQQSMRALDVITGTYTATPDRNEKDAWLHDVWRHLTISDWLGVTPAAWPVLVVGARDRHTWSLDRDEDGAIRIDLGPKPSDDINLATVVGQALRLSGMFPGVAATKGFAYDSVTVTLTTMALYAHNPGRARNFWDLCAALGLPGRKAPFGTWKPKTW